MIIVTVVIMLPIGIADIVLGVTHPGKCDYKDRMGLTVGQYLLGAGIASCAICVISVACYIALLHEQSKYIGTACIITLTVISILFGTAWFIVGSVILFRANIECIRIGSTHVVYALVMWIIAAFQLVQACCTCRSSTFNLSND